MIFFDFHATSPSSPPAGRLAILVTNHRVLCITTRWNCIASGANAKSSRISGPINPRGSENGVRSSGCCIGPQNPEMGIECAARIHSQLAYQIRYDKVYYVISSEPLSICKLLEAEGGLR
jgi:hypothetical protein